MRMPTLDVPAPGKRVRTVRHPEDSSAPGTLPAPSSSCLLTPEEDVWCKDLGMITELLPPNTGHGYDAMRALRPGLVDRDAFIRQVDQRQRPCGYRLIASLPHPEDSAVAVAGFRLGDNLAWGRHLYIDDLSTLPAVRKNGHARLLLSWLTDEARRLECEQIHLDSGVGADRTAAHRLYFNAGFRISSHHFALNI